VAANSIPNNIPKIMRIKIISIIIEGIGQFYWCRFKNIVRL